MNPLPEFLASTPHIDWHDPSLRTLAKRLRGDAHSEAQVAARCFYWVRDQVRHTHDFGLVQVTCAASEVLRHRTGFCYAKSHLLAALLRANGLPAALCYQRLALNDSADRFCLHGFNAVFLKQHGWYRMDPRGDKRSITTEFCPPKERLAFQPKRPGELDVPGLFAEPLAAVVAALNRHKTSQELAENLPDYAIGPNDSAGPQSMRADAQVSDRQR